MQIIAPRVPFTDPRSGLISREWFMFLTNVRKNIDSLLEASTRGVPPGMDGEDGQDSFIPGPAGLRGLPGFTSMPGLDGQDGDDSWIPGTTGARGAQGLQGLPGMDGQDGEENAWLGFYGNASQLLGATWSAPGAIGDVTPTTGNFTDLISRSSVRALLNGSDTVGAGAYLAVANAAGTRYWVLQLSASNNLDWWYYDGATWTKYMTLSAAGALAASGLVSVGGSSPASGAAGVAGTITWDASYIYVCTASGAWKRAALTGSY